MHWNYIIIQVQKRERIVNLCIWIHKNTNKFWEKKALCRFLKKTHLPQDRDTCNHLHLRRKVGKLRDSPGFSQGLIPFPASKVSRPQPAMVVAIKEANKVKSVCLIRSSVLRRNLKKKVGIFFKSAHWQVWYLIHGEASKPSALRDTQCSLGFQRKPVKL